MNIPKLEAKFNSRESNSIAKEIKSKGRTQRAKQQGSCDLHQSSSSVSSGHVPVKLINIKPGLESL